MTMTMTMTMTIAGACRRTGRQAQGRIHAYTHTRIHAYTPNIGEL